MPNQVKILSPSLSLKFDFPSPFSYLPSSASVLPTVEELPFTSSLNLRSEGA